MNLRLERLVWQRAQRTCEYCRLPQKYDELPFQIDHILARKHGGLTDVQNLALACFPCNNHKGPNIAGRDPLTERIVPLFHPRRHKWRQHFLWALFLKVELRLGVPRSPSWKINLPHRVNLRQALIDENVFPPVKLPLP